MTSHVRTATTTPVTIVGTPISLFITTAIELGCVNGVVVSAAIPATRRVEPAESGQREAVAKVVHGARGEALLAHLAVAHPEHRLRELDRHRDGPVRPDPEERTRAAGHDGRRDAGDVPGSDRGGECRHERLEGRERALAVGRARPQRRERVAEVPKLHEAEPRAEVETDGEQQPDRPRAVDGVGRGGDEAREMGRERAHGATGGCGFSEGITGEEPRGGGGNHKR